MAKAKGPRSKNNQQGLFQPALCRFGQITPANVSGLKEVCEIQLNEPIWFWRYVIDYKQVPANNNNRGPGYLDGKIFRGTGDGR